MVVNLIHISQSKPPKKVCFSAPIHLCSVENLIFFELAGWELIRTSSDLGRDGEFIVNTDDVSLLLIPDNITLETLYDENSIGECYFMAANLDANKEVDIAMNNEDWGLYFFLHPYEEENGTYFWFIHTEYKGDKEPQFEHLSLPLMKQLSVVYCFDFQVVSYYHIYVAICMFWNPTEYVTTIK